MKVRIIEKKRKNQQINAGKNYFQTNLFVGSEIEMSTPNTVCP